MVSRLKVVSMASGAALVASLGLFGCGDIPTDASTTGQADAAASADVGTYRMLAGFKTDTMWVGQTEDGQMLYFAEDVAAGQGAYLAYASKENSFVRSVGPVSHQDQGMTTITDATSGKTVSFRLEDTSSDTITITGEDGTPHVLSANRFDEVALVFDTIHTYATERTS